ncbi:MAG: GDSL-type esterase/lipase family protein [Opitutaceae bacterium]
MLAGAAPANAASTAPAGSERWQKRVERYLEHDKSTPPPRGGIVFTGSSSIAGWRTLEQDFPGLKVVNRGIGGTWLADQLHIAPKLVHPLDPKIVVIYSGENDLKAGRSVADVVTAFKQVREQLRTAEPQARIVFLALKPSPSRRALLPAMRDANTQIAALCAKDPQCTFVDIFTPMLDDKGEPRAGLFSKDMLHMNEEGYRLWTKLVAPALKK